MAQDGAQGEGLNKHFWLAGLVISGLGGAVAPGGLLPPTTLLQLSPPDDIPDRSRGERAPNREAGDPGPSPGSATGLLCDAGQNTSPFWTSGFSSTNRRG